MWLYFAYIVCNTKCSICGQSVPNFATDILKELTLELHTISCFDVCFGTKDTVYKFEPVTHSLNMLHGLLQAKC